MKRVAIFRTAGQVQRSEQSRRDYDALRRRETETRKLYGTARWQAVRAGQLRDFPLCMICDGEGRTEVASVCDHITPHRGDVIKFWAGPFQSLCQACHSSAKQKEERGSSFVG